MLSDFDYLVKKYSESNPFCSQCGNRMKARLGGFAGDIFIWECSQFIKISYHDEMGFNRVAFPPIYDPKTGERINGS